MPQLQIEFSSNFLVQIYISHLYILHQNFFSCSGQKYNILKLQFKIFYASLTDLKAWLFQL